MWLHRTQSLCVAVPGWFVSAMLSAILFSTTARSFPSLQTDTLLCYYCPLWPKSERCPNITTQCTPSQVCANSRGYYGEVHVVSAQGCVQRDLCGSHELKVYLGARYNVSHTCCCEDLCNHYQASEGSLELLLGIIQALGFVQEQHFDSCANYTSPSVQK